MTTSMWTARRLSVAAFGAACVLLILVGWVSVRQAVNLREANRAVERTLTVREELEVSLSLLKDAETGQRGFLITGSAQYLEPYELARTSMAQHLERLRQLTSNNPGQQASLKALGQLTQEKLAELRETVVIRERSGFEAAARLVGSNHGKRVMDEIRAVVSSMRAEEERSLEERRRSQERQRRIAMVTGLASLAGALGFLAIAAILMDRALRQRDQAYATQRLAAIVESSGDAIIGKTLEGTITSWNSAATSMFGYSEAEAIGRHITLIVPPERLDEEAEVLHRLVRGEALEHFETVRRHKNGQRVEVSLGISPIRDGKGRVVGASKVARDISERKRIEAERAALLVRERSARAEAEQANRTKDEFLAVLSHELRTPLNSVYGWARMLRAGQLSDADTTRALESIVRNSDVQIQLIDDLLDISRIHAGKMRLDVQTVDLKAVAEAALDVIRPAAVAKAIRIQTVLDPRAGPITGDPNRLQQVIWNLLTNAVKFTPKGGLVQVHLQRVNSHVEIVVSDTGEGIAPDLLPFIFERFRQADSSSTRPHAGLGLGLALVKYLVELHGGSTTAHSAGLGQGATFLVRLPLTVAQLPTEPTPRQHPTVPSAVILPLTVRLDDLRVLVIDDDPDALRMTSLILGQAGAMVQTYRSAQEGLAALQTWRPDVVISDIEMPGEDGYVLIRKIRALDPSRGGKTPAIALTAYGRPEDRLRTISAGYNMHVPKPVEPAELAALVASLAGR
jgi:PAS domain S-box-containing protein